MSLEQSVLLLDLLSVSSGLGLLGRREFSCHEIGTYDQIASIPEEILKSIAEFKILTGRVVQYCPGYSALLHRRAVRGDMLVAAQVAWSASPTTNSVARAFEYEGCQRTDNVADAEETAQLERRLQRWYDHTSADSDMLCGESYSLDCQLMHEERYCE